LKPFKESESLIRKKGKEKKPIKIGGVVAAKEKNGMENGNLEGRQFLKRASKSHLQGEGKN